MLRRWRGKGDGEARDKVEIEVGNVKKKDKKGEIGKLKCKKRRFETKEEEGRHKRGIK